MQIVKDIKADEKDKQNIAATTSHDHTGQYCTGSDCEETVRSL